MEEDIKGKGVFFQKKNFSLDFVRKVVIFYSTKICFFKNSLAS